MPMIRSLFKSKPRRRSLIAFLLALALLLPAWWYGGLWQQERLVVEKRTQTAELLKVQGRSLSAEIGGRTALVKALKAFLIEYISHDREIVPAEFNNFAAGISSAASGVRTIIVARDGIIQWIYPEGSPDGRAGRDLLRDARPPFRADVQRAVRSRKIVIGDPYALRPKGFAFAAQEAIYAGDRLWGLISVVLDLPLLLSDAGMDSQPQGLQIALLDRSDHLLFGEKTVPTKNPVFQQVDTPDGSWKLAALPAEGWTASVKKPLLLFRGITLGIALLTAVLIGLVAGYQAHLTQAIRRRTGVLQRSLTDRRETEEQLNLTLNNLRQAMGAALNTLALTVESKDQYKTGHHRRVADLARTIATEMGLSRQIIDGIRMASSLHDIGKISVPAEILSKSFALSDAERHLIKMHPQSGYDILKQVEFPWPVAKIVWQHHERMDGSGYPLGLKGEEILLEARILAVADVVEAMASNRSYRTAPGLNKALEEIAAHRDVLYDPTVVDACLCIFKDKDFRLVD